MYFYFLSERSGRRRPPAERSALYLLLSTPTTVSTRLSVLSQEGSSTFSPRRLAPNRDFTLRTTVRNTTVPHPCPFSVLRPPHGGEMAASSLLGLECRFGDTPLTLLSSLAPQRDRNFCPRRVKSPSGTAILALKGSSHLVGMQFQP